MASSNLFPNVNGEKLSPRLRQILQHGYQLFHHFLIALQEFLRIIYCIFIDFPLFICSDILWNYLDRYPSMRSKLNVLNAFLRSVEQMLKNFGRYLFNSVVVKTALYRLENVIKTSEAILKRLLRVIDCGISVVYRCHRCQFLSSISAHHDDASTEDETVLITTEKDFDLADADHVTDNCLSGPKKENLSVSLEKAAEKISNETVDGTGKDIETDIAGKRAKTVGSTGIEIETPNASDSEGENINTIHNCLTNVHSEVEGIEKFFILFYKTFVLHPFNAYVAVLHFIRNVTFDVNDYCQRLYPTTSSGRKIVSPRRMIRSRFLLHLKKMTNEVVHLAAADDHFKLILAETGDLIINCNQSTSRKRKISLDDMDACSSSSGDPDYVPEIPYSDLSSDSLSEEDFSSEDNEIEDCVVPQHINGAGTQTNGVLQFKNSNDSIKNFDIENEVNEAAGNEVNEAAGNEVNEAAGNEVNEAAGNEVNEAAGNEVNEAAGNEVNGIQASSIYESGQKKAVTLQNEGMKTLPVSEEVN